MKDADIERAIVRKTIRVLNAAGWRVCSCNVGDGPEPVSGEQEAIRLGMSEKDCRMWFRRGELRHWVWFVYGKGARVIFDVQPGLELIMKEVTDYASEFDYGHIRHNHRVSSRS